MAALFNFLVVILCAGSLALILPEKTTALVVEKTAPDLDPVNVSFNETDLTAEEENDPNAPWNHEGKNPYDLADYDPSMNETNHTLEEIDAALQSRFEAAEENLAGNSTNETPSDVDAPPSEVESTELAATEAAEDDVKTAEPLTTDPEAGAEAMEPISSMAPVAEHHPEDVPAEPTDALAEPMEVPAEPTDVLAEPTSLPAEPTDLPAEPTDLPAEPTDLAEPGLELGEPGGELDEPTMAASGEVEKANTMAPTEEIASKIHGFTLS